MEPVTPDLDVVVRKCCQGRGLKFVVEHGLEHRKERITAQMEEKAQWQELDLSWLC